MSKTNYRKMYDKNNKNDVGENIKVIEEETSFEVEAEEIIQENENNEEVVCEVEEKQEQSNDSSLDTDNAMNDEAESETDPLSINKLKGLRVKIAPVDECLSYKKGTVIDCVGLNVRKEPSLQSEIVHVLSVSDKIKIIDEDGEFYKINKFEYDSDDKSKEPLFVEGYCLKKYIRIEA